MGGGTSNPPPIAFTESINFSNTIKKAENLHRDKKGG
jgi:hypothetical protein